MERINNLVANVVGVEVGGFVALPLVLAVVFYGVPANDLLKVSVFGVCVLLWALQFPRNWNLSTRAADFWYYVLAGLGVILFFANATNQRDQLELSHRFDVETVKLTSIREKRLAIESLLRDPSAMFDRVRQSAGHLAATMASPELPYRCVRRAAEKKQGLPSGGLEGALIDEMCEALKKRATVEAVAKAGTATELAELAAHLKGTPRYSAAAELNVAELDQMLGVGPLRLSEVARYLSDTSAAQLIVQQLSEQERRSIEQMDTLMARYADAGRVLPPRSRTLALQYFLWPYLVLIALGLKLARFNYYGPMPS